MPVATPQSRAGIGQTRIETSRAAIIAVWIRRNGKPALIVAVLLGIFVLVQSRVPLRTAVQIGADEGFELAKATLCLKGYKLYTDIWCDQPPLHTWLITQAIRLERNEPLTPSLSPSDGERVSEGRVRGYSVLSPRLVSVGFAALLLMSVFIMALHVARAQAPNGSLSHIPTFSPEARQAGSTVLCSQAGSAVPLWTAALSTVLLMASPGFLELSSSCMMEIPALAPAVAGLCVLLIGRQKKWHSREIGAGILFGIGLGMKLLGLVLLPLAALVIWLRCRPSPGLKTTLSPSDGERIPGKNIPRVEPLNPRAVFGSAGTLAGEKFHGQLAGKGAGAPRFMGRERVRGFRRMIQFVFPRGMAQSLLIVCASIAFTFVALDLAVDRGAFLRYFHQSWAAHFTPAVSFDYGSPSEHRFPPSLLLKNWDMTIPAALGIFVLLRRIRENPIGLLPVAWLVLMLAVFAMHTPWWSYYYVHIAVPLSLCAAVGVVFACSAVTRKLKTVSRRGQAGRTVLLRQAGGAVLLALFALCSAAWTGARVYLQIVGIRNSPQTYYSLVLKEIARFKPFTEWIYADNLTYSFHSGIPMPPQLAVVSLKRLWSGEMTIAGVADAVRKFKPGLIALRNDTRELPFQDLLDAEYRVVYQDAENRLYAHRTIANKPDQ